MTREIKFRAKSLDGIWEYGELHLRCNHPHIHNLIGAKIYIESNTVGQFTSLYDKNGKEIYEGDILVRRVINDGWGTHDKEPLEVVFMNGAFGIRLDRGKVYEEFEWICKEHSWSSMGASGETKYEYEVIGNIYDNPELLKEN